MTQMRYFVVSIVKNKEVRSERPHSILVQPIDYLSNEWLPPKSVGDAPCQS